MGKYTSLAHKIRSREPQPTEEKPNKVVPNNHNRRAVDTTEKHGYDFTTYDINDFATRCKHGLAEDECAVCSGYVRWLIAGGDARVSRAFEDPEGMRREYWQSRKEDDKWIVP